MDFSSWNASKVKKNYMISRKGFLMCITVNSSTVYSVYRTNTNLVWIEWSDGNKNCVYTQYNYSDFMAYLRQGVWKRLYVPPHDVPLKRVI